MRYPAAVEAAIKFGRCEYMEVECSVRDFRARICEARKDDVDVRSILALPPVMDQWRVMVCSEGVYLVAQQLVDLNLEVLPGLPPDALKDLKGE